MSLHSDVIIIGAGIVGAACAVELVNAGYQVSLIEADTVGSGATAAGMGHLVVMDDTPAQLALTAYSCELWRKLSSNLPAQVEYRDCGTIWVAVDDEEMAEVERKARLLAEHDIASEILDSEALAQAEPNLRKGLKGGLLISGDAVLYPPTAAMALIAEACSKGATLLLGKTVTHLDDGLVHLNDGIKMAADLIIVAAGSASTQLIPELDVQARKGHLVITERYPNFINHQLVELGYLKSAHELTEDSVAFNVQPRSTGQVLIGSSRQYGSTDRTIDRDIVRQMLERAVEYMPALQNLQAIRIWTGFRPATTDKLPLIGLCPGYSRVYLATGHEGLGITTSLGTAKLLADYLLGHPTAIPIAPYLPDRHMDREPQ